MNIFDPSSGTRFEKVSLDYNLCLNPWLGPFMVDNTLDFTRHRHSIIVHLFLPVLDFHLTLAVDLRINIENLTCHVQYVQYVTLSE